MLLLSLILTCLFVDPSTSVIRRFSQLDFDKWIDVDNFLVILFCNSNEDKNCLKEREKLKQISDEMIDYKDLVFGYITKDSDSIIFARYNIDKSPIVKLFAYSEEIKDYPMNIRNTDLKDLILNIRSTIANNRMAPSKASRRTPKPIVIPEIDWMDMATTVKNPDSHSILILYDDNCGSQCEVLHRVAKTFENEKEITFFKMSIEKAGPIKDHFPFERNPSVFWYPKNDKEKGFIYASNIAHEVLVEFINDNAGLSRDYDGKLKLHAGRILEIDQIIRENIISILLKTDINYVIFMVEKKGKELPHAKKYIDYYIAILKEIRKGEDPDKILQRELKYIEDMLSKKTLAGSEVEDWKKFHNIVSGFIEFAALRLSEDQSKRQGVLKEDLRYHGARKDSRHDEL